MKLKAGDRIRYKSDKAEGVVVSVDRFMIVVQLDNGETGHLHPDDARTCLELCGGEHEALNGDRRP